MLEKRKTLEQIHINTCPGECYSTLENILSYIYLKNGIKTQDISEQFNLPKPTAVAVRNELISYGFIEQKEYREIQLSARGVELVRNTFGYGSICFDKYHQFIEGDTQINKKLKSKIQFILNKRPNPKFELDQAHCTVETLLERIRLSIINYDIIGRKILCLGDDDCLSIAIAIVLKAISNDNGMSCDITVIDIDERLIHFINNVRVDEGLSIDLVKGDLRFLKKMEYSKSFDTVYIDPPYTINGLELFLSVANFSLKSIVGGKVYLSFGQKKIHEMIETQSLIHRKGFLIEKIIKKFNRYEGASILGSKSNMYYLIKTDLKHVPTVCNQNIYTYSNKNKNVT